jgi:hypothetical protein
LRSKRLLEFSADKFSADMCLTAASEGVTEHLKILRKHGCPWDKQACLQALTQRPTLGDLDREDIVIWVQSQPE